MRYGSGIDPVLTRGSLEKRLARHDGGDDRSVGEGQPG